MIENSSLITFRKLASIQLIDDVFAIPGADKIEAVRIGGWECVVKKNEFAKGDKVIYCEIDSFLPVIPEYEFLRASSFRDHPELGEGFRIRTVKLRKQLSQGLVIKPTEQQSLLDVGSDLTKDLNIKKWETPQLKCLAGDQKGNFPYFLCKSDQERIQNLSSYFEEYRQYEWNIEEKLDGCLDENTLISTHIGDMKIKDIIDSDENINILSFNEIESKFEWDEIIAKKCTRNNGKQWFRLTLENGTVLDITENHLVYLPKYRCWRRVDQLTEGDEVFLN